MCGSGDLSTEQMVRSFDHRSVAVEFIAGGWLVTGGEDSVVRVGYRDRADDPSAGRRDATHHGLGRVHQQFAGPRWLPRRSGDYEGCDHG